MGNALTAPSACTTISVFVNPNINFTGGTPMPAGLFITKSSGSGGNATWQVSGTPSEAGNGTGTYTFTDSNPGTVTMTVNFNILGPVVVSGSAPAATVGRPYPASNFSATGGTGSGYNFSIGAGALPPGLTLSSGGVLSGTPSSAGTFSFTVRATDGGGNQGNLALNLTVNPVVSATSPVVLSRTVGQSFAGGIAAAGGTAPLVYSLSAGSLPAGAALNSANGSWTGTATSAGSGSFTVTVTDSYGSSASAMVNWTISPIPQIHLATPNGQVGSAYLQTIGFTGAISSVALSGGTLPPGLTLGGGGTVISGTPTAMGSFSFALSGTDSNGVTASGNFTIVVTASLAITPASLPAGVAGSSYAASIGATGGAGGYNFAVSGGGLPPGLSLAANGQITGIPTTPGTYSFTVSVTDSASQSASGSYSITVSAPPVSFTGGSLAGGVVGIAYSASLSASGGLGGLTYSLAGGNLAPGLTISPTGSVSGTPGAAGSFVFSVNVVDSLGTSATAQFQIVVVSPLSLPGGTSMPAATVGAAYTYSFAVSGGTGPLQWSISPSPLPGLVFSNGTLSGNPGQAGTQLLTVTLTDGLGAIASREVLLTVNGPLAIQNSHLGGPYSRESAVNVNLLSSGGTAPVTWSLAAGSLPAGVSLSPGGQLRGSMMSAGSFPLTVRATDAAGAEARRSYLLTVGPGPQFATQTLPGATLGSGYRQRIEVVSLLGLRNWQVGTYPETFPPGLRLAEGEIEGTPTRLGTYDFSVTVEDEAGKAAEGRFQLQVNPALELMAIEEQVFPAGRPMSWRPVRVGGTAPFHWTLLAGTLPGTLQLNPRTGEVTGTAPGGGRAGFTLEVRDGNGATARRWYSISFGASNPLRLEAVGLPASAIVGQSVVGSVEVSGGRQPYQIEAEGLPAGIALVEQRLTGQFRAVGTQTARFAVTDAEGQQARVEWRVVVWEAKGRKVIVAPRQIRFQTLDGSLVAIPHILRLAGEGSVRLEASASWLKLGATQVELPATVEVRVDSVFLRSGTHQAQIRVNGEEAVEVLVDQLPADPEGWRATLEAGPFGGMVAFAQANAERVPLRAELGPNSAGHYLLGLERAETPGLGSVPFWLERRDTGGQAPVELTLENGRTGQKIALKGEGNVVGEYEASAKELYLEPGQRVLVAVRASRIATPRLAAHVADAGVRAQQIGTPVGSAALFEVSLERGSTVRKTVIRFYDERGREVLQLPIEAVADESQGLEVTQKSVLLSTNSPEARVQIRNRGTDKLSFRWRGAPGIVIEPVQGVAGAGEEVSVTIRGMLPGSAWSRQTLWLEAAGEVHAVEVDSTVPLERNRCRLATPVIALHRPGISASVRQGISQSLIASVENPCGQRMAQGQMWLRTPEESSVPMLAGPDGRFYGTWTPLLERPGTQVELLWLDPVEGVTATRWISVEVLP